MRYVTYNPDTGVLTGAYIQEPPAVHLECMIQVSDAVHGAWTIYRANTARDGVELLPPDEIQAPSETSIVASYMAEVQRHMDSKAVEYGYDNLLSVITYADEPAVERYQLEGLAFRAWRSLCWAKCEEVLAAFKAGERTAPSYAELIAEMPPLGLGAPAHFS